jgi:Ca2+-binding EF-hand superfamily protein
MRPTYFLILSLILAAPSVPTFAKAPKEKKTQTLTDEEAFKALDKDGDSLLSKEEFCATPANTSSDKKSKKAKASSPSEEQFDKLDTDKDGKLTLEEFSKRESGSEGTDRKRK